MLQVRKGVHRSLLLQADQAPGQPAQAVHGASFFEGAMQRHAHTKDANNDG